MKRGTGVNSQHSRRRRVTAVAVVAVASLGLVACSNGGAGESGEKVLNVWYGSEPGQKDALTSLIAQWDEEHPELSVEITAMGPELNPPSLLPALSSGEGPDLWAGNIGSAQSQAFIDAGLVHDLTPAYCDSNWDQTIPDELAAIATSDDKLWAVPNSIESTGMFYRKSIFEKMGLSVPTTWEDFMTVVKKLKDNGYPTPIGAAGQDAWPVTHLLGAMWAGAEGPDGVNQLLFGDGTWTSTGFTEATEEFEKLADDGDFGPDPLSYAYEATNADFYNGVVPMTYTGGFVIPDAQEDAGENFDDIGVFALPTLNGGPIYANESPGEGWYVNANAKQADAAEDLLNYLFFTDENRTKILEGGLVPAGPVDLDQVELPSVLEELLAEQNKYRDNGVVPAFFEVSVPGSIFEAEMTGVQGILAGSTSADELLKTIQSTWETEKQAGNIISSSGAPKC